MRFDKAWQLGPHLASIRDKIAQSQDAAEIHRLEGELTAALTGGRIVVHDTLGDWMAVLKFPTALASRMGQRAAVFVEGPVTLPGTPLWLDWEDYRGDPLATADAKDVIEGLEPMLIGDTIALEFHV